MIQTCKDCRDAPNGVCATHVLHDTEANPLPLERGLTDSGRRVLIADGSWADDVGAVNLRQLAIDKCAVVIAAPPSRHEDKAYWPLDPASTIIEESAADAESANPPTRIWVWWSDDKRFIRKWHTEPFIGGTEFVALSHGVPLILQAEGMTASIEERLLKGQQFNAWEISGGYYMVGLGPISDCHPIAWANTHEEANLITAALCHMAGQAARSTPLQDKALFEWSAKFATPDGDMGSDSGSVLAVDQSTALEEIGAELERRGCTKVDLTVRNAPGDEQ